MPCPAAFSFDLAMSADAAVHVARNALRIAAAATGCVLRAGAVHGPGQWKEMRIEEALRPPRDVHVSIPALTILPLLSN